MEANAHIDGLIRRPSIWVDEEAVLEQRRLAPGVFAWGWIQPRQEPATISVRAQLQIDTSPVRLLRSWRPTSRSIREYLNLRRMCQSLSTRNLL
jgi:hypothetical protein